jgi:hypothetical protein
MSVLLLIRYRNYVKLWTLKVPSSTIVKDIKKEIEKNWKILADTQCLSVKFFDDMSDDKQVSEFNNDNNSTISIRLTIKKNQ